MTASNDQLLLMVSELAARLDAAEKIISDPDTGVAKINERIDDESTGLERLDERLTNHGDRLDSQLSSINANASAISALEADSHTHGA